MTNNLKRQPKLMEQVRERIRLKHLAYATEKTYLGWIRRYILFHGKRHPKELSANEITQFLSHLATDLKVAPATQNQALTALVFLYREVLGCSIGELKGLVWAKTKERKPVVLTQTEVARILANLDGVALIMVCLLYGAAGAVLVPHAI